MQRKNVSNEELDRLIEKYSDTVYRIAFLRCHNKYDADDVFQDVFVKLVKHAAELEDDEYVKAWLIRVTINQCNSIYTNSWHEKTEYLEDQLVDTYGTDEPEENETKSIILEAVRQLKPPEYRDVIYLFYYEEYSIKEISQILNKSTVNVKVLLNRARKKLKTVMEEKGISANGRIQG